MLFYCIRASSSGFTRGASPQHQNYRPPRRRSRRAWPGGAGRTVGGQGTGPKDQRPRRPMAAGELSNCQRTEETRSARPLPKATLLKRHSVRSESIASSITALRTLVIPSVFRTKPPDNLLGHYADLELCEDFKQSDEPRQIKARRLTFQHASVELRKRCEIRPIS